MDIQVISLVDSLRIDTVISVPNMVPRTLDVRGPDFRSVTKVEVNDEEAPAFFVQSRQRILIQVPTSQERSRIRSLAVLSNRFTSTESSLVRFEVGNFPKKASGIMKLIQTFILWLLRTPGRDSWYPNTGGGLQRVIGAGFSKANSNGVVAEFTLAVSRTRSQLVSRQASNTHLNPDEKLATANVLNAVFNAGQTALIARVELVAQSGKRASVGLEV